MSSQDEVGISFAIAQEQSKFRLLELPPALVDLLSQKSPPVLTIKSSESSAPSQASHAVLCTPSSTYQLRQVNTSNSVLVIRPLPLQAGDKGEPNLGLSAISQCPETLELHPVTESAISYLNKALTLYEGPQDADRDIGMGSAQTAEEDRWTKMRVFASIPLSDDECEQGWTSLVAFVCGGKPLIPSPRALMQIWQLMLAAAIEERVDLGSQFLVQDLWQSIQHEGYPEELFQAVLHRLSEEDETGKDTWASLSRECTIEWLGATILQAHVKDENSMPASQLIRLWKDMLPETWRDGASLECINDSYTHVSSTRIRFSTGHAARVASAALQPVTTEAKLSRNWHEKLKRSRS